MGKQCSFVYYNTNGEVDSEYYANKDKYGEEVAEAMFISKHMKNDEITRYSIKGDSSESLWSKHDRAELSAKGYTSPSSIISAATDGGNSRVEIENSIALNLKLHDGLKRPEAIEYFKYDKDTLQANDNKPEFEALRKDAIRLNEFQRNKGSLIHNLLEQVFLAKKAAKPGEEKYFKKYFAEGVKSHNITVKQDKDLKALPPLNLKVINSLEVLAEDLVKKVDALNKKHPGEAFELIPEVALFTDKVKYKDKPMQGFIDLMIYSPVSKIGYIIDYKTKSKSSYLNFDRGYGLLNPPFHDLKNNDRNKTRIQTTLYSIMAQQAHGITILGSEVLLITTEFADNGANKGEREWHINRIDTDKTELSELKSLEGKLKEELKISDPSPLGNKSAEKLIEELFDGKLITTVSSKTNYVNSQEGRIREENKVFKWFNIYDKKTIIKDSKKEVLEEIGKIYDANIVLKERAAPDLVSFYDDGIFPDKSVWKKQGNSNKAMRLLNRFQKGNHTLESSHTISGIGKDIIVATDKSTGEVTLISIAIAYDTDYNFNETTKEDKKSTIFGPFISDKTVNKKYGKNKIPKATTHSLSQLKLALLAAELKLKDPVKYANITSTVSTTLLEDKGTYNYSDIGSAIGSLKEIEQLMIKENIAVPKELTIVVNNDKFTKPDSFSIDYFNEFAKRVQSGSDPLKQMLNDSPDLSKYSVDELRKKLKNSINTWNNDKYNFTIYDDIVTQLDTYIKTVYNSLLLKNRNPNSIYIDKNFIAANRAFIAFKKLMVLENPEYKGHILGQMNSLTTVGDPIAEQVHLTLSESEQRSRDVMLEFMTKHTKLQKKLIAESPDVNILHSIFSKDNFKKVFGPMMRDGYDFDENNANYWMQFRDPKNLHGAQKEYVEFFNSTVKTASKMLFNSTELGIMYPNSESEVYDIEKWPNGAIPIIPKSASLDLQEVAMTKHGINASLAMIKKILTKGAKSTKNEEDEGTDPWAYSTFFPKQVDSSPGRGSKDSRNLLNITDTNKVIENKQDIEMNPAVVLNIMMIEAARKEHMSAAAFTTFAIDAELAYKKLYAGVETDALRNLIKNIVMLRVHGKVKDEGTLAKVLDTGKNITSLGMFWGSIAQVVTEAGTATAQVTSQTIANVINKTLFGGENKYDNRDQGWAVKMIGSSLGEQIITDTGMYNTSLGEFTSNDYIETNKKLLFQTKWGMLPIKMTLQQATQVVVLAQMHKEGITEKCFVLNKNTGRHVYDETKDTRFYVYDKDLKIKNQQSGEPTTESEKARHRLWKAHRKTMAQEGGIDRSGKMRRPFINAQFQSIKSQAIRMFGAMDPAEALAFEVSALGRGFATYKRWIRQKAANYYTPKHKSYKEGRWLDKDGELTFIEEDFEGIFQTLQGLVTDIKRYGNLTDTYKNLTNIQKRNLSKLLADLLLTTALLYLVSELKDSEFAKTALGKELVRGFANASSDIFPMMAVHNAVTGSPMAAVSIALNTTKGIYRTAAYAATGDFEKAMEAADKAADIVGVYRARKAFSDLLIE